MNLVHWLGSLSALLKIDELFPPLRREPLPSREQALANVVDPQSLSASSV